MPVRKAARCRSSTLSATELVRVWAAHEKPVPSESAYIDRREIKAQGTGAGKCSRKCAIIRGRSRDRRGVEVDGTPVWSHGIVCTGGRTRRGEMTFAKGCVEDPSGLSLQPRRKCQARHRHPRRRRRRSGRLEESHPRCSGAQSRGNEQAEAAASEHQADRLDSSEVVANLLPWGDALLRPGGAEKIAAPSPAPRLCSPPVPCCPHLEPEFKRVTCRGLQALPRRSAHRPAFGAATSLS